MTTSTIPAFHVSNFSKVTGSGIINIQNRMGTGTITGIFIVKVDVHFNPAIDLYPVGTITIEVHLNDGAEGIFNSTSIELINSYGKINPTVYLTGRCNSNTQPITKGCRYWLMIVNNKKANEQGTPDIVGFAIHDNKGERITYGTGPLRTGNFDVETS